MGSFSEHLPPFQQTVSGSKFTDENLKPVRKFKTETSMISFTPTTIARLETDLSRAITSELANPQQQTNTVTEQPIQVIAKPAPKRSNIKMVTLRNSKKTVSIRVGKKQAATTPKNRKGQTNKAKKAALRRDIKRERMYRGTLKTNDKICLTIGQLLQKLTKYKLT